MIVRTPFEAVRSLNFAPALFYLFLFVAAFCFCWGKVVCWEWLRKHIWRPSPIAQVFWFCFQTDERDAQTQTQTQLPDACVAAETRARQTKHTHCLNIYANSHTDHF